MNELDPELYTIAWLAPLEIEAQAALHILDNRHQGRFPLGRGDDYIFQAGDICGHNVIIATIPAGQEYGTGSGAALASQVKKFFPNLWFGLLVGVAAGLPSLEHNPPRDIRLGDVLVGLATGESSGLVAYDLGKETGRDGLQLLRFGHVLANTEAIVRSAIGSIKLIAPNDADGFLPHYERIKYKEHSNGNFTDPGQEKDMLYQIDNSGAERLIEREPRPESKRTRVWYGPIGSGEKLMKNSQRRNELRDKYDLIGLEMEAAGAMNRIPVGVIRGVCDYGDEHKNKEWQPYAAAMAAAYAKRVLEEIRPKNLAAQNVMPSTTATDNRRKHRFEENPDTDIDRGRKKCRIDEFSDNININNGGGTQNNYFAQSQTFVQSLPQPPPSKDCLKSLAFPEMEDRSKDIDPAVEGTCEWLLRHETYQQWAASDRSLLWIKGKPGSGKSTLLQYALENVREQMPADVRDTTVVLSFFFHGRGSELQKTPLGLLRSLLHQVLSKVPDALSALVDTFQQRCTAAGQTGENWNWHPRELQDFFRSSLPKVLEHRSVLIFIDALDECGRENAVKLVWLFKTLLESLPRTRFPCRICFTCRHYPILDLDCGFEICVEHGNEEDISTYVETQLAMFHNRTPSSIPKLITDRAWGVFMWARLVVKLVLDLELDGAGLQRIEVKIRSIPPDLDELYQELIKNMVEKESSLKLIQCICFAERPLSLQELRWAMIVSADCPYKSLKECQGAEDFVSDDKRLKRRVQTLSCGLAEIVQHGNVVQFIHQSVKDFFVEKGISALDASPRSAESNTSGVDWVVGIAHYQLSRSCIRYMAMKEIAQAKMEPVSFFATMRRNRTYLMSTFPLLEYAAKSWLRHTQQSEEGKMCPDDLLDYFAWPSEALFQKWVLIRNTLVRHPSRSLPRGTTMAHILVKYQLTRPLQGIVRKADHVSRLDASDKYGMTPLLQAAVNGCEAVMDQLLALGANIESKDNHGFTQLIRSSAKGGESAIRLLLEKGANIEARCNKGYTSLYWAVTYNYASVAQLLLTKGAKIWPESLFCAVALGRTYIVQMLVEAGTDIDSNNYLAPSIAARKGHKEILQLLYENGAQIDVKDENGRTPLLWAIGEAYQRDMELIGHAKAMKEFYIAKMDKYKAIVHWLLDKGVNVQSKDVKNGRTALSWAIFWGYDDIIQRLLERGADIELTTRVTVCDLQGDSVE